MSGQLIDQIDSLGRCGATPERGREEKEGSENGGYNLFNPLNAACRILFE